MPQYQANWLASYKRKTPLHSWRPNKQTVLNTLGSCNATGFGSQANPKIVDTEFIQEIHDAGFEFHTWTVNGVAQARELEANGVDSITTDQPKRIREALETAAL